MTIRKLCDSVCYNWHILPWQLPVQATRMGWACSAAHIPGSYGAKESEVGEVSKECTHVMKHHGFFLAWPFDTNKMTIHDHIPHWVIKKKIKRKITRSLLKGFLTFFEGGRLSLVLGPDPVANPQKITRWRLLSRNCPWMLGFRRKTPSLPKTVAVTKGCTLMPPSSLMQLVCVGYWKNTRIRIFQSNEQKEAPQYRCA